MEFALEREPPFLDSVVSNRGQFLGGLVNISKPESFQCRRCGKNVNEPKKEFIVLYDREDFLCKACWKEVRNDPEFLINEPLEKWLIAHQIIYDRLYTRGITIPHQRKIGENTVEIYPYYKEIGKWIGRRGWKIRALSQRFGIEVIVKNLSDEEVIVKTLFVYK